MRVVIAGEGRTVFFLARAFLAKGHSVSTVSRAREESVELARRLRVLPVHGDPSDPEVLEQAGTAEAAAVLAAGSRDSDNLVVCQLARGRFGVPRTLAVVNDPENEEVFRKLGVEAMSTSRTLVSLVEQRTELEEILNMFPAAGGRVILTELVLPPESPAAGRPLRSVALPEDSLVVTVIRGGEVAVARGGTVLRAGDRLLVASLPEHLGAAVRALTGERR